MSTAHPREHYYEHALLGRSWRFHTTWGLFSPRELDPGTELLLEHMPVRIDDVALDLGCGYGPIGLAMAAQATAGRAVLVDKDFVAIDYARRNAEANGIGNAEAYLSNGFSHVPEGRWLSLVASNLPAKSGKEMYYFYFYDARARMLPGARIYVVTISGLREFIKRVFGEVFGNYEKVRQGRNYTLASAVYQPPSA